MPRAPLKNRREPVKEKNLHAVPAKLTAIFVGPHAGFFLFSVFRKKSQGPPISDRGPRGRFFTREKPLPPILGAPIEDRCPEGFFYQRHRSEII